MEPGIDFKGATLELNTSSDTMVDSTSQPVASGGQSAVSRNRPQNASVSSGKTVSSGGSQTSEKPNFVTPDMATEQMFSYKASLAVLQNVLQIFIAI